MNYAEHEAARAKARDALRRAITAEIVARYEGLHDKAGIDPVGIALAVLDYEEAHWIEARDAVLAYFIATYPDAVPS